MTATKGRRWCIYHKAWERAPICEVDQFPNRLVGYSPPQAGKKGTHLWVCAVVKSHKVSVVVDGIDETTPTAIVGGVALGSQKGQRR